MFSSGLRCTPSPQGEGMETRALDLDGSIVRQTELLERSAATVLPLAGWGPRLRIGCGHGPFRRFERALARLAGSGPDREPLLTFCGSGDFHHVSLALVRRQPRPCNLLVIDNHPDWMRGVPLLHCGTWLYHAARLPQVARVFHVGGEVDFDNAWRWLAPWPLLRSGKIIMLPAVRRFHAGGWRKVPHEALRPAPDRPADRERLEEWLRPFRAALAARPLYVSLDKDVLGADESVVNWDSGRLTSAEVQEVLRAFLSAADLAGMDVVGDWSPVRVAGVLRRALHRTEHPPLAVDLTEATRRNQALNLLLLETVEEAAAGTPRLLPFPTPAAADLRRIA
jgi:arginase family enzyme